VKRARGTCISLGDLLTKECDACISSFDREPPQRVGLDKVTAQEAPVLLRQQFPVVDGHPVLPLLARMGPHELSLPFQNFRRPLREVGAFAGSATDDLEPHRSQHLLGFCPSLGMATPVTGEDNLGTALSHHASEVLQKLLFHDTWTTGD